MRGCEPAGTDDDDDVAAAVAAVVGVGAVGAVVVDDVAVVVVVVVAVADAVGEPSKLRPVLDALRPDLQQVQQALDRAHT